MRGICLFVSCLLVPFKSVFCFPVEQSYSDRPDAVIFPPRPPADIKQPFPSFQDRGVTKPRLAVRLVRLDDARHSPGHLFQDQTQLFPPRSYHFHIKPVKPQEPAASNASQSSDSPGRDSKVKQRFSSMFSFNTDAYFPPIPDLPPPPRSPRRAQRKRIRSNYDQAPKIPEFPKIPRWMDMIVGNSWQFSSYDTQKTPQRTL